LIFWLTLVLAAATPIESFGDVPAPDVAAICAKTNCDPEGAPPPLGVKDRCRPGPGLPAATGRRHAPDELQVHEPSVRLIAPESVDALGRYALDAALLRMLTAVKKTTAA
jgi:hypothetical protein